MTTPAPTPKSTALVPIVDACNLPVHEPIAHERQSIGRGLRGDAAQPCETYETTNPIDLPLADLVGILATAKVAEGLARDHRIGIEERIAAKVPGPDTGQKSVRLEDGTSVTVKRGFNYNADCKDILDLFVEYKEYAAPVDVKTTRVIDDKGYEWFRRNEPEIFEELTKRVTVTPKKVAVTIGVPKK